MSTQTEALHLPRSWPGYRTIWRWHFYAGLTAIPSVLWLATTGAIYLFRPQIEAWLDRPYDHLDITNGRASAQAQVSAALKAVPGSNLHFYQLPTTSQSAVQIIVGRGADEFRVHVHPQTARVMRVVNENSRPMTVIFHLHGELLMGDRESMIVELAASWAIIMIATGIFSVVATRHEGARRRFLPEDRPRATSLLARSSFGNGNVGLRTGLVFVADGSSLG